MVKAPLAPSSPLRGAILEFLDLVCDADTILVVSHEHPDGDAVGSTLALALWLEQQGKAVTRYNVHPVPYNLGFLPGAEYWHQELGEALEFDLTVVLDCGWAQKLGAAFPAKGWGGKVAVVDHHKTVDRELADVVVHDPGAAATGAILWHIFCASQVEVTLDIATCLYACLMTDTGGFRYASTSPQVFEMAAQLLRCGVEPWEMTSHLYESQPFERVAMLGEVLSTLTRSPCGRLALLRIERGMWGERPQDQALIDGFINHARGIAGVEVAAQLEEGDHKRQWQVSFRSKGLVDVSLLAARFGGSGGRHAAACLMQGSAKEVTAALSQALASLLTEMSEA